MVLEQRPELRGLELSEDNVEPLLDMFKDGNTRWYAMRRARGFATAGLLAGSYWNPDLHPRGPDGKFIETGGFVRWLLDGLWTRGRVENILPDGKVIVRPDDDKDNPVVLQTKQLYGLPTPKGRLTGSPDPNSANVPETWEKTGAQGGSNPGGFYTTTEPVKVMLDPTGDYVTKVADSFGDDLTFIDDYPTQSDQYKEMMGTPQYFVATYTDSTGTPAVVYGNGGKEYHYGWQEASKAKDLKLWVTTDPAVQEAARLTIEKKNIDPGTQFYVKQTKSSSHGANEMLANELYKLAGVPIPDLFFGDHQTVASQILRSADPEGGGSVEKLSTVKDDPDVLRQIRENMAVDAWLANWDVAGLTYDNIMVVDGIPYRIDTGGSILYRAQGGTKGSNFGPTVGELDSFRNPSLNPSSSHVFGDVSQAELRMGGEKVAAISPKQIKDYVSSAGLPAGVSDTLIARRADIIDRLDLVDPYVTYQPPKLSTVGKQMPSSEQFWNPLDDQWQAGIVKKTPSSLYDELTVELTQLSYKADPDEQPVVGDTVTVVGADIPTALLRVTAIEEDGIRGVSAFDPDNETEYVVLKNTVRVVEPTETVNQLYTQYKVAQTNEQLRGHSLQQVLDLAFINRSSDKPPITLRPWAAYVLGDDLWKQSVGDYVFQFTTDDMGDDIRVVYEITGITEGSISLTNVIDKKERILTWSDWATETPSDWGIPDDYTQDQTLGLLKRDGLIDEADIVDEVQMEGYPEEVDAVDVAIDNPEKLPGNTTPVDLDALGVAASMSSENGVNVDISVGEAVAVNGMHDSLMEEVGDLSGYELEEFIENTSFHDYIGQTIIISDPNAPSSAPNALSQGIWFVKDATVQVRKKNYYDDEKTLLVRMYWQSPSGKRGWISVESGKGGNNLIQTVNNLDASIPQLDPVLKPNGDINLNGKIVGQWNSGWQFNATIFPEFSVSGSQKKLSENLKKDLRKLIGQHVIPQIQPDTIEKSEKTKGSKTAILGAAAFKTRADFPDGTWIAAPDGFTGIVQHVEKSNADPLYHYPSAVRVVSTDGKTRILNANLLLAVDEPSEAEIYPDPVETDVVEKAPLGAPPFYPLKYGDGNDPRVGQKVKSVYGSKVVEGTVSWVTPPGGKQASITPYADVVDADGKKWKKSLSTITLIEEIDGGTPEGLPDHGKAAAEIIEGFTPEQTSDVGMKYVSPDGKTLAQAQWEKDKWLGGSPGRKLTKDGYAPRVGMRMRTNDDKPVVVVGFGDIYKTPNSVIVVDLSESGGGKPRPRAVSALWVDHQAELGSADHPIEYVGAITGYAMNTDPAYLPDGAVIYKASGYDQAYDYEAKAYRPIDRFFTINESGEAHMLQGSTLASDSTKTFLADIAASGRIEKVAVIDRSSPLMGAFSGKTDTTTQPAAFVPYNPAEFSHEEALSGHYLELTGVQVVGAELAVPIPSDHLKNLPMPADAVILSGDEALPEPPPITGVVGALDSKPDLIPIKSVVYAGMEVAEQSNDTSPGSGTEFSFGDAEYIEDMQVRSQIARDSTSGQVFVEFHFRMLESKAEATSDKLLTASKDVTYGKWESRPEPVLASKLVKGDTLSVRKSSMSDALKPSNGDTPNVRVVADPVFLGNDSKGVPIYRVTVAAHDGTTGAVDIQERSMPSIRIYDWNPHAIASQSSATTVNVNPKAAQEGWIEIDSVGYDKDPTYGGIAMDETGAKLIKGDEVTKGAHYGNSGNLGKRLHRSFDDGSHVRINAVPSSVSGTSMGGNDIRRFNEAGMVTIRVPYTLREDPEAFQASISRAMEAVGIPPEKQAPASVEQIALFALNKVYKAHAFQFSHREDGVSEVSLNDAGVVKMFDRLNKELHQYLGRNLTFDDIELHVFEDGRLQVLMSKEVAAAITKRQGNAYYRHSGHYDTNKIVEILAGPNRGLMGGSERFSTGIFTTGQSTHTDMSKGSGNRVYMSARTSPNKRDSNAFVFSPHSINRSVEIYANPSDGYGNRSTQNQFLTMSGGYEYMMKNKLESERMAFFMASSESARQEILNAFKAKGVTHIGGRPIEDFVVTEIPYDMSSDAFLDLGSVYGETITVEDLISAFGNGSSADAGAGAGGGGAI